MSHHSLNSITRRIGSLTLAVLMLLTLCCSVQPLKAYAAGEDLAVIGLIVTTDNEVQTTLYDMGNTSPSKVQISYYVNGSRISGPVTHTLRWADRQTVVEDSVTLPTSGNLTVIISAPGDSNYSNNNRTTTLNTRTEAMAVPGQVTGLSVNEAGQSEVRLSWNAVSGATGYRILCNGIVRGTTSGTSYTVGDLTAGVHYTFTVDAYNVAGSGAGASVSVTTGASGETTQPPTTQPPATQPPETQPSETEPPETEPPVSQNTNVNPVQNLNASVSGTTVNLSWDAPNVGSQDLAATGYQIWRDGNLIATVSTTSYTDNTGNTYGISYDYQVVAINGEYQSATTEYRDVYIQAQNPSGQPDLIVESISWSPANPRPGDSVVFTAVIKNIGTGNSPSGTKHGLRFSIGGRDTAPFTWNDKFYGPLGPGQTMTLTATGGTNGNAWSATEGTHTVYAYVDDDNQVSGESNNDNNVLSVQFTVNAAPPVEVPGGSGGDASVVYVKNDIGSGLTRSAGIAVTVNDQPSGVFDTRVNESRYWDRLICTTMPVTVFELNAEGEKAVVRVALDNDVTSVVVRPVSEGIQPAIKTENGQKYVEFTVTQWGSYSVEFNGSTDKALQVFVNPPYHTMSKSGYTYVDLGTTANITSFGKVYGSGVVLVNGGGPSSSVWDGARIEGITFLNPSDGPSWNMQLYWDINDVHFDYYHMITCGKNSDGITIQSSYDVQITNSYFRTWDDSVVLKIYESQDTFNITVDNCVFWTDLAQSMEIGAETNKYGHNGSPEIYNVKYTNNTVIHGNHKPALSIHNMDNANIHNITYKNIVVEDASMGYNARADEDGWPIVIDITNVYGGQLSGTTSSWSTNGDARGQIHDVTFENIQVLSWRNSAGVIPGIRLANSDKGGQIYDIKINGLYYRNSDGSTMTITRNNIDQLCGWNPDEEKTGAVRVSYDVLTFGTASNVTLPDPMGGATAAAASATLAVANTAQSAVRSVTTSARAVVSRLRPAI